MEGRGLEAALLFVTEQAQDRWPAADDVREIHRLIFQDANPTMAGQYRQDSFWPHYIRFPVPQWQDVYGCMMQFGKLLDQARADIERVQAEDRDETVIEWVARLHHRLERIHPFQDGNGRTGRTLANWMLIRYELPAFHVTSETRVEYIEALGEADEALTTQDLQYPDFYEHHDRALQRLIDFIADALFREADEVAGPE
jgi:Fic family protein